MREIEYEASERDALRPIVERELLDVLLFVDLEEVEENTGLDIHAIHGRQAAVVQPGDTERDDKHELSEKCTLRDEKQLHEELGHQQEGT